MPAKGTRMSPESCRKISEALTGKKHSDEHRRNNSLARRGKHLGKNNPNWRHGEWTHGAENFRVVNAGRHARKHGVLSTLTLAEWLEVLAEYDHRCAYCFDPYEQLDHVKAIARGGENVRRNVVPACGTCNRRKQGANGWVPSIASRFWPKMAEELYA